MPVGNFVVAYTILRDLGKAWTEYEAYNLGLIDDKGSKIKSPKTKQEKDSYNSYMRIIFNLKRLLNKTVGSNAFAHKAVSTLLLRENYSQDTINILERDLALVDLVEVDNDTVEQFLIDEAIHI